MGGALRRATRSGRRPTRPEDVSHVHTATPSIESRANQDSQIRKCIYEIQHLVGLIAEMHELSIAANMVEIATEEVARRGGVQVHALHVKVGQLSGVAKEALMFSWEVICEGTPLKGSRLVIEDVPVVVYCPACQVERTLPSVQAFSCPVCAAPTPEVLRGRELEVVALEIEDEQTATG